MKVFVCSCKSVCRYVCVCVCVCNVYKCPQRPLRAGVELLDVNAKNQADVLWKTRNRS